MDRLEMLSIEVRKLSTKPFVITTWYRPPNSSVDLFSHLDILLRKLDTENIEHYLMGDINCDLLSENNANVNALVNVSDVYGLKQLITEPTRITPSSRSLIDLIFTNQPDLISFSGVSHVGISDHSLILGPLLFLLYINDLPQCLDFSHPRMYADDTSITYAGKDLNEIDDYLNKDLKSVNTWLSSKKLILNLTKTEFLVITSRQRRVFLSDNPSLTINNFPIEQVSSTKSLGVSIDENLSWKTHIETVCKKISSALGLIKRIRDFVPFYTLLNIFNGWVKPQFDYCSLVWDCCSTGLAEKLQKLQNRAVRILLSAPYDSSATDLFRRLHWKNLRNQRLFAKAIMMFKILNGQTPDYLSNKFIFRNDTTIYRLRNSEMRLALPQPRTDYVRKSFSYSGAALWNSLPTDIRVSKTLGEFKTKLSNFSFE